MYGYASSTDESAVLTMQDIPLELLLGPAAGRYFGAGFREVNYTVTGRAHRGRATGLGAAHYPDSWSIDGQGKARRAHLSSIDAVVLPLLLIEQCGSRDLLASLESYFVASIRLRAGTSPWEQLDEIPIDMAMSKAPDAISLDGTVGNIRVAIHLLLRGQAPADVRDGRASVYGTLLKTTGWSSFVHPSRGNARVVGASRG